MCVNILCISYKYFYVKTNINLIRSHNITWNKYINFKLFLSLSLIKGHFIIILKRMLVIVNNCILVTHTHTYKRIRV